LASLVLLFFRIGLYWWIVNQHIKSNLTEWGTLARYIIR